MVFFCFTAVFPTELNDFFDDVDVMIYIPAALSR